MEWLWYIFIWFFLNFFLFFRCIIFIERNEMGRNNNWISKISYVCICEIIGNVVIFKNFCIKMYVFFIFFIYRRLRKFGSIIVWNWIISYCFVDRFKVILINFGFFFIFICVCVWVRIFVIGIEGWIFVLYFLFILFWNINKLECWY